MASPAIRLVCLMHVQVPDGPDMQVLVVQYTEGFCNVGAGQYLFFDNVDLSHEGYNPIMAGRRAYDTVTECVAAAYAYYRGEPDF